MSKKLQYFHLNGLAESIRYILHYSGQKFEDVRHDYNSWPIPAIKDTLPYGQLPIYEEKGYSLNQSLAIARYLASQCKLLPTDPWEQAVLDAVVFNIYDYWGKIVAYIKEQDPIRKEAMKKEIFDEIIDYFFSRFEKELKQNKGFFGGKLTWADFVLVGIVESTNLFLNIEVEKTYPAIQALMVKISTLPGIKEYIATRKPYVV